MQLNDRLWQRVKAVWDVRKTLKLDQEQARLLERTYKQYGSFRSNHYINRSEPGIAGQASIPEVPVAHLAFDPTGIAS